MYCYSTLPPHEIISMVEQNPENPELRLALMESYMNASREYEAKLQAVAAAELFPDHAETQIWSAIWVMHDDLLRGQEQLEIACQRFSCIELVRRAQLEFVPATQAMAGEANVQTFDELLANEDLDEDTKLAAQASKARLSLGVLAQNSLEEAVKACHVFLQDWTRTSLNLQLVARIHQQAGLNEQAEELFRELLSINPKSALTMVDLGYLLKDDCEAIEFFRTGLELCNFDQRARCGLAERLINVERYDEALKELMRVPADSLFYCIALTKMSELHQAQGDLESAKNFIEKALTLQPGAPQFLTQLDSVNAAIDKSVG